MGGYPTEHVIRFIARNYYGKKRNKIKILDFGCGQGAHTWYLAREGFNTYAFDGSPSAVRKCKEKLTADNLIAQVSVMEGSSLSYTADFFDAVVDNVCVYANDVRTIRKMYKEIHRVLKPEGKLITACFGEDLYGYKTGDEIEPWTFKNIKDGVLSGRGITHIFNKNNIEMLLEETGFIDISTDWIKYLDRGDLVHQYICTGVKSK